MRTISQCKNYIVGAGFIVYTCKHGIPTDTIFSIFAVLASRFAYLCPSIAIVVGDKPIIIFDFELGRNAIFTICTVCTIASVFSICSVFAIRSLGLDLIASFVGQPVAIECPIVDTIHILLHADSRCRTVLAIGAVHTVLSVFTVKDRNRIALAERDGITDLLAALHDWGDTRNIIIILQGCHNSLQRRNIRVHLLAEFLQLGHTVFQAVYAVPNVVIIVLA